MASMESMYGSFLPMMDSPYGTLELLDNALKQSFTQNLRDMNDRNELQNIVRNVPEKVENNQRRTGKGNSKRLH